MERDFLIELFKVSFRRRQVLKHDAKHRAFLKDTAAHQTISVTKINHNKLLNLRPASLAGKGAHMQEIVGRFSTAFSVQKIKLLMLLLLGRFNEQEKN